jgi:hypothetical protein
MKTALLKLAGQWRDRATSIETKYTAAFPSQTKNVVDMIELCATELEQLANENKIQETTPGSQATNAS